MRFFLLAALLFLFSPGCALRSPTRAELEEVRVNAALGTQSYTSLESARRTLGFVGSSLLRHERFEELEALLADYEQSDISFGDLTSPSQYLYGSFIENYIGEREDLEYFLSRWKEHSPSSKYPTLILASVRSQLLKNQSHWHNMDERQILGLRAAHAHLALHAASQHKGVLESPQYWESRLKVGLITGASPESMDLLLSEVVSREPERWTAYALRAYRQAPRFTGGNLVQYLQEVDRLTEQYGVEVYAACAWFFYEESGYKVAALREVGFDWQKIQAGFEALIQRYPDSRVLPGYYAHLAMMLERPDTRDYLLDLGDNLDPSSFGNHDLRRRVDETMGREPSPGLVRRATIPVGPERALLESVPWFKAVKLRRDVASLLTEEKFETLEQVASAVRGQDGPTLAFYLACLEDGPRFGAPPVERSLELWSEAIPDSGTVNTLNGALLVTQAWNARGGGWGRDVSDEAWKEFRRLLDQAAQVLEKPHDVYACKMRITTAMGRGESLSEVDRQVALAREFDPDSVLALSAKAVYLLPRWKGSKQLLTRFFEEEMERLGDAALPLIIEHSGYRDAMIEDLPGALIQRGLDADPGDSFQTRSATADLRVVVAKAGGDRRHALEALNEIEELQTDYTWAQGDFELWKSWAKGAEFPDRAKVAVLEAGQYSSVLPSPKKVGQAKDKLEIISGRSLGLRLRFLTNQHYFAVRKLVLERPGPGAGEVRRDEQSQRLVPGSVQAGDEELLLWHIEEGEHQPGVWKLSVLVDNELVAVQEYQMLRRQSASEPGMRLDYQGPLQVDDYTGFPFPQEAKEPLETKLGTRFGAYIRYIGKPSSAHFEWELPQVSGGKPVTDGARIDCSGVDRELNPQTDFSFVLEKPEELVSGPWKLGFRVNDRPVGELDFDLKKTSD